MNEWNPIFNLFKCQWYVRGSVSSWHMLTLWCTNYSMYIWCWSRGRSRSSATYKRTLKDSADWTIFLLTWNPMLSWLILWTVPWPILVVSNPQTTGSFVSTWPSYPWTQYAVIRGFTTFCYTYNLCWWFAHSSGRCLSEKAKCNTVSQEYDISLAMRYPNILWDHLYSMRMLGNVGFSLFTGSTMRH